MGAERDRWNGSRYTADERGHYESWFMRANHADRPLAFWIRYTIFSPIKAPERALGELWAIWFDGEHDRVTACKQVVPIDRCRFASRGLDVSIDGARLDAQSLEGDASGQGAKLCWSLRYSSPEPQLLMLPEYLYRGPFPKARAVVGSPLAVFDGELVVDGQRHDIDGWVGSQNHNWGSRHYDRYAWGQVAGFDDAPDAFFEAGTARVKIGPFWTPRMTVMVLRLDGEEHRLNTIPRALAANANYGMFWWWFESASRDIRISGSISASRAHFVALPYDNPPGGRKTCLNTKIARCEIKVTRRGEPTRSLTSAVRAAFEILTDDTQHRVPVLSA